MLVWMDDDDVFTVDAFASIRKRAMENPEKPLIFRFVPNLCLDAQDTHPEIAPANRLDPTVLSRLMWRRDYILWDDTCKGIIEENCIGGHQFVAPNVVGRLGRCTDRLPYDYDFIRSTVDLYPGKESDVVWCPEIVAIWRPEGLDIPNDLEPFAPYIGGEIAA